MFGFIALCILGQPLRDGCQHTRACWGYGGSAECQGDPDRGGALNCLKVRNSDVRADLGTMNCGQMHWDHFEDDDASHKTGIGEKTFWGFDSLDSCRDYWGVDEKVHEGQALVLVTGLLSFAVRTGIVYFLVKSGFDHSARGNEPPRVDVEGNGPNLASVVQVEMASAVMIAPPLSQQHAQQLPQLMQQQQQAAVAGQQELALQAQSTSAQALPRPVRAAVAGPFVEGQDVATTAKAPPGDGVQGGI